MQFVLVFSLASLVLTIVSVNAFVTQGELLQLDGKSEKGRAFCVIQNYLIVTKAKNLGERKKEILSKVLRVHIISKL